MKKIASLILGSLLIAPAFAGGDPEFVPFPETYRTTDTVYATINRANGKQVAVLYANEAAVGSIQHGDQLIPGSRIIMEIYKKKKDADGNPIKGADGIYEKGDLAAIGVMEKSINWPSKFPQAKRSEEWGFALYDPQGKPKENELECASCHIPLDSSDDNMFTHDQLSATRK